MAVTMQQIAERAGLSRPTVSQILSNKGYLYSPKTREKVCRIAKEMGYRPNAYARSVVTKKFGAIALLLSTEKHRSYLPGHLLDGINDELEKHNYHLSVMKLPDEKLCKQGFLPKALREWLSDGLLVNYNVHIPNKLIQIIENSSLPAVWINVNRKSDCLYPNDYKAAREAVRHLVARGYKKIAYVSYSFEQHDLLEPTHYSIIDRYRGYLDEVKALGLKPLEPILPECKLPRKERLNFTYNWLMKKNRPDAIIAYARSTALPIIWCASQSGLDIPKDLAVITFSSEDPITELGFTVTSFDVSEYEIGRKVTCLLMEKIKNPELRFEPYTIDYKLIKGDTT